MDKNYWILLIVSIVIVCNFSFYIYSLIQNKKDNDFKLIKKELYWNIFSKLYSICGGILIAVSFM